MELDYHTNKNFCDKCKVYMHPLEGNCVVLKKELEDTIMLQGEMLCSTCLEKRLGHKIRFDDLATWSDGKLQSINKSYFQAHKELEDEHMNYKLNKLKNDIYTRT